jgi:predicted enzyme related to lactoylglutathione lyase
MKIKMTSVHVNDPIAAFKFYTEVLGFQETLYMPEAMLAIVHAPGQDVALLLEPSDNPIARDYKDGLYKSGLPVIVMGVANVQAEHERLTAKGVKFSQAPKTDEYGTTAVFDDTCGNYVQLHQD